MRAPVNAIGTGKVLFFPNRRRLKTLVRTLIKYQMKTEKTMGISMFLPIART